MRLLEDPVVKKIATEVNKKPSQVLLRFLLDKGVSIIPKSKTPHRIIENSKV